jgi:ferritin-like metal-binding protein YciE
VAERADDQDVVDATRRIAGEEQAMMERLEANVDAAADAAVEARPRDEPATQIKKYLADAHAIEEQAIALLSARRSSSTTNVLAAIFEDHLSQSREHAELVQSRLSALGGDASSFKDAAMRLGALHSATFFQGHPDTPGKLVAFGYAFEHLEIGGYEQLERVANVAGDVKTSRLADKIPVEERNAAVPARTGRQRSNGRDLLRLEVERMTDGTRVSEASVPNMISHLVNRKGRMHGR